MTGPRALGSRRRAVVMAMVLAGPVALFGCSSGGGESSGPAHLTWYINPDNGGQATLAKQCSEQSEGAFTIDTQVLPNEADAQREQLVRRLAAQDDSIDLMSLDPPFVAEFANAGYLLPTPKADAVAEFPQGVLAPPLEPAYGDDQLVAPPFWANTQLLWFRKSVARA